MNSVKYRYFFIPALLLLFGSLFTKKTNISDKNSNDNSFMPVIIAGGNVTDFQVTSVKRVLKILIEEYVDYPHDTIFLYSEKIGNMERHEGVVETAFARASSGEITFSSHRKFSKIETLQTVCHELVHTLPIDQKGHMVSDDFRSMKIEYKDKLCEVVSSCGFSYFIGCAEVTSDLMYKFRQGNLERGFLPDDLEYIDLFFFEEGFAEAVAIELWSHLSESRQKRYYPTNLLYFISAQIVRGTIDDGEDMKEIINLYIIGDIESFWKKLLSVDELSDDDLQYLANLAATEYPINKISRNEADLFVDNILKQFINYRKSRR